MLEVNASLLVVGPTELRENKQYIRYYTVVANSVCVLLAPTAAMLVSTCLIIRQMIRQPAALRYTSEQVRRQTLSAVAVAAAIIAAAAPVCCSCKLWFARKICCRDKLELVAEKK